VYLSQEETMDEHYDAELRTFALNKAIEHYNGKTASEGDVLRTARQFYEFLIQGGTIEESVDTGVVLGDEVADRVGHWSNQTYSPPQINVSVADEEIAKDGNRLKVAVNGTEEYDGEYWPYPNANYVIHLLDSLRCTYPADMLVSVIGRSLSAQEVLRWCDHVLPADRVYRP
jgi:hypothetical protein